MNDKTVDIFVLHDRITLRLETRLPAKREQILHSLAEFARKESLAKVDVDVRDYSDRPEPAGGVAIEKHYFFWDDILDIPSRRICFSLTGSMIRIWCDRFELPVNLIIHLAATRKGMVMIHSGAVEYRGKRLLFPAFGGIGKTTLMAAFLSKGGKLLGDDLNFVSMSSIWGFPQDFSVYPYHVNLLGLQGYPNVREFRKNKFIEFLLMPFNGSGSLSARLARRLLNRFQVPCINVPPRLIFGDRCFADGGSVDAVYYLVRVASNQGQLVCKEEEGSKLAADCMNILLHEWHESLRYLFVYSALSPYSLIQEFERVRAIYEGLFTTRPCYRIEIPASMDNETYQREMLKIIESEHGR